MTGAWPRLRGTLRATLAGVSVLVLLLQPSVALADVFSTRVYLFTKTPAGEVKSNYCSRSGVVDTARNYAQSSAYVYAGSQNCLGTLNTLPAGWIGTRVDGFRNGVLCAQSSYSYSSSDASNWQLYSTLCTNPSGLQDFRSLSRLAAYDGVGGYQTDIGTYSPVAQY